MKPEEKNYQKLVAEAEQIALGVAMHQRAIAPKDSVAAAMLARYAHAGMPGGPALREAIIVAAAMLTTP